MDDTYRKYRQWYEELVEMRKRAQEQTEQQRRDAARRAYDEALLSLETRFGLVNTLGKEWTFKLRDDPQQYIALHPTFWPPRDDVYVLLSFDGTPQTADTVIFRSSEGRYESRLRAPCSREEIERAIAQVFVPAVDPTAPKLPD